jgi:hypothetical protein
MFSELRWALRGVRARGWSGALSVGLIAMVLAANTLVFSATDALVFNTLPYREPDRLVTLSMANRTRLHDLRSYSDLFSAVHGYLQGSTFVTGAVEPTFVSTVFVTPGMFNMLGVAPQAGREFVEADVDATDPPPAVIDDALAREKFGNPGAAIGRLLETTERPLLVVGVMPAPAPCTPAAISSGPRWRAPSSLAGRSRWRSRLVRRRSPTGARGRGTTRYGSN